MPSEIPYWYQPTGSGETDSIDRRVEAGLPVIPAQIELRNDGIFWSFDPEHRLPRVNPFANNAAQFLGNLRAAFALMYQRSSKRPILEEDRIKVIQQVKQAKSFHSPDRRTLTDFLNLQNASQEDIVKYANEHGVLDICEHILPHGHHLWCAPPGWPIEGWTSLDVWRRTANVFVAILRLSSDMKDDVKSIGRASDWQVLFSTVQSDEARRYLAITAREQALNTLQSVLNNYLQFGGVTHLLARTEVGWKHELGSNVPLYPLFGNLAFQLSLIMCGNDAAFTCSGCGNLYVRQGGEGGRRKPKAGNRNYCQDCGKPRADLDAKRDYLARIAEARRLRSEGLTTGEIAVRLRADRKKVAKWIRS